jgi:ABC-type polysaccharide/polyol phosphate transport system ATPase subunit
VSIAIDLEAVEVYGVDTHARARSLKSWILGRRQRQIRIPILRGVTFHAAPGDRIAVLGPNGSGKSSLLKVISGNYPIHAGLRRVAGTVAPLIEMGAGFDGELTGRRNIKLSYAVRGRLRDYSRDVEQQIIDFAELGDRIDVPLKTYSAGMSARLAFSSAIFQRPDILLLDEVFAVGDAAFVAKSRRLLQDHMDRASITLIVSHDKPEVLQACTRAVLMRDGRIAREGSPVEIYERYAADTAAALEGR